MLLHQKNVQKECIIFHVAPFGLVLFPTDIILCANSGTLE